MTHFDRIRRMALVPCLLAASCASLVHAEEKRAYDFLRNPEISGVALNSSGDLFIAHFTPYEITSVRVSELSGERTADLFRFSGNANDEIQLLEWAGDRTLVFWTADEKARGVVRVRLSPEGIDLETSGINWPGILVSPLRQDEEHVLWSPHSDRRSVYRVALDALSSPSEERSPFRTRNRVSKMNVPVAFWVCDSKGTPRLAFVEGSQGEIEFWQYAKGASSWQPIHYEGKSDDDWIFPVGVTEGGKVIVASRFQTGRMALYAYTPGETTVLAALVQDPKRDLYGIIQDSTYAPVHAAYHHERGRPQFTFIDPADEKQWDAMESRFPDSTVFPVSRSMDGKIWALWIGGPSDPGRIVTVASVGVINELGQVLPRAHPDELGAVQTIEMEIPNIGVIEAYLTLPPTDERRPPLIVNPHGGPIGVADVAVFNPANQFLASRGFAVLQGNYRGSGGLGTEFQRAGWREWGRGIEDDIDAVYDRVMAMDLVNDYRVCIIGGSYGGYSALMSIIRHPKRFRCAVSTAGVTDISLMFSTSDWADFGKARDAMQKIVGDPDADYEEMKKYSPVYRVREIETPLLLIHGDKDRRVDVEHTYRLGEMLRLHGKEHRIQILPGVGHGGWSNKAERERLESIADFLDWYLD